MRIDSHDREIDPKDVKYVIGDYVEHTLAHGKKTLTVFGEPDLEDVVRVLTQSEDDIKHIHFGAERSFNCVSYEDAEEWIAVITHFLTLDYWCTLEIDALQVHILERLEITKWNRFIPLISVKIPFVYELGYNCALKIDDTQFNHSNTGVWCWKTRDLLAYDKYTSWSDYGEETIVTPTKYETK